MKVLIIEDEQLAQERIEQLLHNYDPSITIVGKLESIEDAVVWLKTKVHPDIIFLDIHLADGYSFGIFEQVDVKVPIIFTTAFDQFALQAFKQFSIDYLLKPITAESVASALNKYTQLYKKGLTHQPNHQMLASFGLYTNEKLKTRFLVKVGQKLSFIPTSDISMFWVENKNVYLYDNSGNKYSNSQTLDKIETQLSSHDFFRINRQQIVHINAIQHVKTYMNNRLAITLKNISHSEDIIVARERVQDFKLWLDQ